MADEKFPPRVAQASAKSLAAAVPTALGIMCITSVARWNGVRLYLVRVGNNFKEAPDVTSYYTAGTQRPHKDNNVYVTSQRARMGVNKCGTHARNPKLKQGGMESEKSQEGFWLCSPLLCAGGPKL